MPEEVAVSATDEDIGIGSLPESSGVGPDEKVQGPSPVPDAPAPLSGSPEPESDGPAENEPIDLASVDLRRVDPMTIPEGRDRDAVIAFQKQVKDAQGDSDRSYQELQRERQELAQQRSELLELQKTLLEQRPMTQEQTEAKQDLVAEALSDPNLTPAQRQGLQFMKTALDQMEQRLEQKWGTVPETVDSLKGQVESLGRRSIEETQSAFFNQAVEAREKYGPDIDRYADAIRLNMGVDAQDNPIPGATPIIDHGTGKPHTVTSLYELFSGKTASLAADLRGTDKEVKAEAKTLAAGTPPGPAKADPNAKKSDAEVLAEVRKLGFGSQPG